MKINIFADAFASFQLFTGDQSLHRVRGGAAGGVEGLAVCSHPGSHLTW